MKQQFFGLAGRLARELRGGEVLLCNLDGERSDFVRFNQARVRQAGSVTQRFLSLRIVHGGRQASAAITLAGDGGDLELARDALKRAREALAALPEDPWLLINEEPRSSESERRGALASAEAVVEQTADAAHGLDLVGFYAGGTICRGFANSLGQQNWHEVDSFNFDWSLHGAQGRAVKSAYAGFDWQPQALRAKVEAAARSLAQLAAPERRLAPGEYRAYLAPRALDEVMGLLCWGGFSARARQTRQSPLLRMQEGERLSPRVSAREHTAAGIAPGFQGDGFVKPASVTLIERGALGDALVSPRSAKEYGLASNAAGGAESPLSLELDAGELEERDVLAAIGTGLYLSNLWYLNFSDRAAGRVTGMTRFAAFWVEGGRIAAPAGAMRFDDTLYRVLGTNLEDLTRERELLLDPSTYGARSTASSHLPGALLRALRFTL